MKWACATIAFAAVVAACGKRAPPLVETVTAADPLAPLRAFEDERRHATVFLEQPAQDRAFGADPYALAVLRDGRVAGVLRGRDALVVLDADLREVARVATPRAPSAIAATDDGVVVASELSPVLARYRIKDGTITRLADIAIDAVGVRDVVIEDGKVAFVEEHDDRFVQVGGATTQLPRGPFRLARSGKTTFAASLIDHTITALPGNAQVSIDGPYWGLAAAGDIVLAGGVEDHPLDRTGGFFGNVDSFVYGYRYTNNAFTPLFAVNVSEHGLIVPKAMVISGAEAFVTSYGGDRALRISVNDGAILEELPFPPGTSAVVRRPDGVIVAANPLLDAWVTRDRIVKVPDDEDKRTDRERLGEALFFTGLMAPHSSSEGAKSRFSCETCHFEGYVDGRTHHTGRGDIRATTKPLVGLFNNRPHFSRALDPDLAAVAENEFRVAGAPSSADPHFALATADAPWLGQSADATELRLALMSFLMSWTHRSNPRTASPRGFTADEKRGAEIFRDRCEGCHAARAVADDPATHVAFDNWEMRIFHGDALVWGSEAYAKTGIEPYVNENGARVPSLRRLYKKRPYFTNGGASSLRNVLELARFAPFSHAGGAGAALPTSEIAPLLAFLDLL